MLCGYSVFCHLKDSVHDKIPQNNPSQALKFPSFPALACMIASMGMTLSVLNLVFLNIQVKSAAILLQFLIRTQTESKGIHIQYLWIVVFW